jgi:hypothetical protein
LDAAFLREPAADFSLAAVKSAALAAGLAKIEKLEAAMQVLFWRIARRGLAKLAF